MTMKQVAQKIRRKAWCILALKKSFAKCLMIFLFLFLCLTVIYASTNQTLIGIYDYHKNTTTVKTTISESQLIFSSKNNAEATTYPKRVNIVIMSYPRSGSSFLGDIFNHHPGVFYLFEPLRTVQMSYTTNSLFEFDFSSSSYQNMALEFLEDVMNCNFSSDIFVRYLIPQDRNSSKAMTSPPFCINGTSGMVCHKLISQELETVCKNKYNVFAAKLLTPRMPNASHDVWSKNLVQSCSSNGTCKCKIIHLVRDPRAVVNSLKSVGFFKRFKDPRRELSWFVKKICHQMELDVKAGMFIRTSLPDGYRLIRFEDLAQDPLSAASELFKFTGIEMFDTVMKWLNHTTRSVNGHKSAYSTSRDSKQVVSSWRTKMSSATVQIVEIYCGRVMRQLNYGLTGGES
ncbi:carbohydrate sulfotransferase 5-like [Oculina patagonica]